MLEAGLVVAAVAVILFLASRRGSGDRPDVYYDMSDGERNPHRWGYTDTRFEFDGPRSVRVTGSRYPLSGYSMPHFLSFVEEVLDVSIREEDMGVENEPPTLPPPVENTAFVNALLASLGEGQVSQADHDRLVHSHGQLSVDEIYRLLYGPSLEKTVDLVAYPESEENVRHMVKLAIEHGVCLVPFGGGTNVSGALVCPPEEQRMIVSVDMRRMNKIVWLDEKNLQACVEAGMSGKELERELDARGYTSGHDPDSVELSTLGGWIATNASGMKKNKYGNIEDIVLEATLITPTGDVETKHATPRNSVGIQPRVFLFGSEGNLGIITKAIIKVHRKPAVRKYGALGFPSFEKGVGFLRELRLTGVLPASIRLVNNNEFRFGQALKPAPGFWMGIVAKAQKVLLLKVLGFKPLEMVACTMVMEGTRSEVRHQEETIFRLAKRHKAMSAGAKNGKRGYTLTFGIAYIRDFFNQFNILGETFETSVPWDRIIDVIQAVESELIEGSRARGVQGKPYLAYRVTQTYHTGVCIYFTMGFSGAGLEDASEVFHEIEHRLRQVILDHGGSLSHHHGIGKIRRGFLPQVQTENSMRVLQETKKAMDPTNVFGIRNGVFDESS